MSGNSNFVDYEPLQNERGGKASPKEDVFSKTTRPDIDEDFSIQRKRTKTTTEPTTFSKVADNPVQETLPNISTTPVPLTQPTQQSYRTPPDPLSTGSLGALVLKNGHSVSFAGLFLFTFLVFFRPYEWSTSLSWLSKSALITAIATLLFFIPTQLGLENRLTIRTREVKMILILLVLGLLSVAFATDRFLAWNSFVEFSKVVAIFIVMVNVLRTLGRLRILWLLILVASLVLSFSAFLDYRAGRLGLGTRITGAIGGLFENPNDLALHLVTFIPIVIALGLAARNPFSKMLYWLCAAALVVGTVVTFSRGGFVGLIVILGILSWRLVKRYRPLVLVAAGLLLAGVLVLAPGAYRDRISTTADDSATARTGELKRSIYITLRHPILGVGMDNFIVYSNTNHATHNAYTQVASEIGIPAAIVYVLFLVAAVKRVRGIPHPRDTAGKQKALSYLAIGIHASLIGYMFTSFFASVAYLWYVYYLAAYAVSITRIWEGSALKESKSIPTLPAI